MMNAYELLVYPNDRLRELSTPVAEHEFGRPMETFVKDMYRLMSEEGGIGLAAPQVGVLKNVLVYQTVGEEEEDLDYLINPKIISAEGETLVEEGCLSLPGIFGKVKRSVRIVVEGQDVFGEPTRKETEAFSSIIIQHEADHLLGKLFIDHISPLRRKMLLSKYKRQS